MARDYVFVGELCDFCVGTSICAHTFSVDAPLSRMVLVYNGGVVGEGLRVGVVL